MITMRHLASPIAKSFSEALRMDTEAGSWIFVAGQVGVAIPPDNKPISFEQEVRVTFDRIHQSLRKLDADMDKIVSINLERPYVPRSRLPRTAQGLEVAGEYRPRLRHRHSVPQPGDVLPSSQPFHWG